MYDVKSISPNLTYTPPVFENYGDDKCFIKDLQTIEHPLTFMPIWVTREKYITL